MESDRIIQQLVPTLFEDDYLLAVGKPAGVDVGGRGDQAANGLVEILAKVRGSGEKLHPVNRLGRYESGVLLLGKDPVIVEPIRKALHAGQVRQEYVAVVLGRMSQPRLQVGTERVGSQKLAAGKDSRRRRDAQRSGGAASRGKRTAESGGRTSVTAIRQGKSRTYVRCRTGVANTHALRASLRGARLRVLGDSFHDDSPRPKSPGLTCLHLTKMTFYHPGRKAKITVTSKPAAAMADAVEGRRDWSRPLHAALTRRLPCVVDPQTDSFRLLTGDIEDVKGVVAEKYGQAVILQVRRDDPALTESLPGIARWYRDTLDVEAVYVKRFVRDRAGVDDEAPSSLHSPKPLLGERMPPEIEIRERGLKFAIRLYEGSTVGLFLDQRENRARVRKTARGKDVLNLFSYTCGFSVAAAAGGASSTVSIDISPKHLELGKANFALNGLDLSNHQFICSDAADYLKRAKRQGRQFDLIIIDAPTFAHGRQRKQSFSIARDLPALIADGAELLRPSGQMMVSTNNRKLSAPRFKELINEGAGTRHYRITSTPRLPPDFAIDREHAKTVFVRFS